MLYNSKKGVVMVGFGESLGFFFFLISRSSAMHGQGLSTDSGMQGKEVWMILRSLEF
jgi:hypothetical protein